MLLFCFPSYQLFCHHCQIDTLYNEVDSVFLASLVETPKTLIKLIERRLLVAVSKENWIHTRVQETYLSKRKIS